MEIQPFSALLHLTAEKPKSLQYKGPNMFIGSNTREIYNYPLYRPYIIERLLIMMQIDGQPGQVTRKGEWITGESCLDPHLPTPLLNCTYSVHIACRYTSHHMPYCSRIAIQSVSCKL